MEFSNERGQIALSVPIEVSSDRVVAENVQRFSKKSKKGLLPDISSCSGSASFVPNDSALVSTQNYVRLADGGAADMVVEEDIDIQLRSGSDNQMPGCVVPTIISQRSAAQRARRAREKVAAAVIVETNIDRQVSNHSTCLYIFCWY
ncbi:hypothetical protein AQUCO_06400006v1 [Aquilegia coerulea]|uniref:Uncharacterized protein n=1 Tax=Aquilegia coerulea TaxID=218851 RepID=A0A2G5CCB8_AQUCA|nr:hypothetical protein AQUCO_06400006v1 [Aquilegia coerulea]